MARCRRSRDKSLRLPGDGHQRARGESEDQGAAEDRDRGPAGVRPPGGAPASSRGAGVASGCRRPRVPLRPWHPASLHPCGLAERSEATVEKAGSPASGGLRRVRTVPWVRYPDARTQLLTDRTGAARLHMERSGSLEGVLDTRQPGGREDAPGAFPGELLGQARCTVEPPLLVTSTEEALEFLPSELLGLAGAPRACNV